MIGYYRAENPGETRAALGGWHDTGDIVAIDAERFRRHQGARQALRQDRRRTRLAAAVEDLVSGLWPDDAIAAIAAPDPKKGERVVLVDDTAGRDAVSGSGLDEDARAPPKSWHPPTVVVLDAIPTLGSGKTDYAALGRVLRDRAA